jgi:hypothetical protein
MAWWVKRWRKPSLRRERRCRQGGVAALARAGLCGPKGLGWLVLALAKPRRQCKVLNLRDIFREVAFFYIQFLDKADSVHFNEDQFGLQPLRVGVFLSG